MTAGKRTHGISYPAILEVAERINWRVEDLIGEDKGLDFSKPFLPESLARVEPLTFLTPPERRTLNHIRANGYLYMFGVVEEFIVPFVLDHVQKDVRGESYRVRSLLEFVGEEAKHIQLFRRFKEEFDRGFGTPCQVIGPSEAIGQAVLAHDPLAVALVILQIEWMTQRHYIESVVNDERLDPLFKSLLKHHWMEEAQHTKLDTLLIEELAARRAPVDIASGVEEYVEIGGFVYAGLKQQVELDAETLQRATGRTLSRAEREEFVRVQLSGLSWTYLGSGMTHGNFLETVGELGPALRQRIEQIAPAFC